MSAPDLRALIARWRQEAKDTHADGDFCCALTREHDADELEAALALGGAETGQGAAGWQPIATAPKDETEILLMAHGMVIQGRYHPGGWSDDTPVSPAEYDGPVWCCFDDAVSFEIEETPDGDNHGQVTHWMPLPDPPQEKK